MVAESTSGGATADDVYFAVESKGFVPFSFLPVWYWWRVDAQGNPLEAVFAHGPMTKDDAIEQARKATSGQLYPGTP